MIGNRSKNIQFENTAVWSIVLHFTHCVYTSCHLDSCEVSFFSNPSRVLLYSMVVKGVVCKKNVAHRRMSAKIEKARILILGGGLEYQRVSNQLSSFDTLLQQVKFAYYLHISFSSRWCLEMDFLIYA